MSSPASNHPQLARIEQALGFLYSRVDYERTPPVGYASRDFKLDRMRQLLARLGTPYTDLPAIHVAGTKGKGSTAAMIGAMLTRSGYRTGVFSSPHLDRVEERIAIDGQPCPPDELLTLVDRVRPIVEGMDREGPAGGGPTYFEVITALGLEQFVRPADPRLSPVDAAVLEVGLGGRLDSTNVCCPRVSVITSISFDHTRQLGNTLESIAAEKAGIIKPGVPVVSGVTEPEAREVIRRACRQQRCRLVELDVDFAFRYRPPRHLEAVEEPAQMEVWDLVPQARRVYGDLSLRMAGRHQAANAAVAVAVAAELRRQGWEIPERAVRGGLAEAVCPARIEVVARRPAVVVDAAHNVASVEALVAVLGESFSARRRFLLFATTREKDVRGMLSRLGRHFDEIIFTRYLSNPRAVPLEELEAAAELSLGSVRVCGDPATAWGTVLALAGPDDLVCATGSFFLAAEIRSECRARPFPGC